LKQAEVEPFRNADCSLYLECLRIAAHAVESLDCGGCHRQSDRSSMVSMDNLKEYEVEGCWRLLHHIFIGKGENN
jgi:hypothetical protein